MNNYCAKWIYVTSKPALDIIEHQQIGSCIVQAMPQDDPKLFHHLNAYELPHTSAFFFWIFYY